VNPHLRIEMLTPASKLAGDPEMWGTRFPVLCNGVTDLGEVVWPVATLG
jgi:hypothetical protein